MYLLEPYAQQLNLSKDNFAFREYYKGDTTTNKTYLSEVFVSVATGHKVAVIATPIYFYSSPTINKNSNGSLVGIWVGALDLNSFTKSIKALNSANNNSRIV